MLDNIEIVFKYEDYWYRTKVINNDLESRVIISSLSDVPNAKEFVLLKNFCENNKTNYEEFKSKIDNLFKYNNWKYVKIYLKRESDNGWDAKTVSEHRKRWWKSLNKLCQSCEKSCKQSSKVDIMSCQKYNKKVK